MKKTIMTKALAIMLAVAEILVSNWFFSLSANSKEIIGALSDVRIQYILAWTFPFITFSFGIVFLALAVQTAVVNITGINLYKIITETIEFILTYKDTD